MKYKVFTNKDKQFILIFPICFPSLLESCRHYIYTEEKSCYLADREEIVSIFNKRNIKIPKHFRNDS